MYIYSFWHFINCFRFVFVGLVLLCVSFLETFVVKLFGGADSLNFCLPVKLLISPSILNEILSG